MRRFRWLLLAGAVSGFVQCCAQTCQKAVAQGIICTAANIAVSKMFHDRKLSGKLVVLDVKSGSLLAFASVGSSGVGAAELPLSLTKLPLAASCWDHLNDNALDPNLDLPDLGTVREMVARSIDKDGQDLAVALRHRYGSERILADLQRYGFGNKSGNFWSTLDPALKEELQVAPQTMTLSASAGDKEWGDALSIGEIDFKMSALHLAQFLQAVGNDGKLVQASATLKGKRKNVVERRIMSARAAHELQSALLDGVDHGTGRGIRDRMSGGWRIGGKTGTGPAHHNPFNGWFAGLLFDPSDSPRFAFAVFVQAGGKGGGAAAEIAVETMKSCCLH